MQYAKLLLLLLSPALLWPAAASAQAPEAKTDLAANAALKYWQAFAQMPALTKEQAKLLERWNKVPLDEDALKLIAASEKSRLYLCRGAKLLRCEWSIDFEDGMGLVLTHHIKARDLARLTALHARHEFAQGHWETGMEDAIAMMALARHVGSDPILICILMRNLIEQDAIDLLAPHLPELKALCPKFLSAFEALPAGATLEQAIRGEKKYIVWWMIKKLSDAEKKEMGSWRRVWDEALSGPARLPLGKSASRIETFDEAIGLLENLLHVFDRLAKLSALPWQEFDQQYVAYDEEFRKKTADRVARAFVPAMGSVVARAQFHHAQMTLFNAAVAVIQGGPDKLKEIKDPFGNGPFDYHALDKGFELKSQLQYQGKPVILRVGVRGVE
jgi:hypothetical protein